MINNKEDFKIKFWDYFLALEEDFTSIEKIIPVDPQNTNTFSITYMKILFSICSEIDVVFKEFIEYNQWYSFTVNDGNIGKYKDIINLNLQDFSNEIIVFSKNIELKPFVNWKQNKKPDWWKDYNDLKHKRTLTNNGIENYKKANQKNILDALGALYQLEMYFYKSIIDTDNVVSRLKMPVPQSKRYRIKDWIDNIDLIDNRYIIYVKEDGHLWLEGE
ncbi:hypothetical protein WG904_18620 [Pedobacter sp. Du54]|uniref:hypothetical protein n=1 Tax=Pedobacter anseongensis TaxID=3133439 RepID=UPI0030A67377